MILYWTGSTDPCYNLACEEYLLRCGDDDVFMLWQNDPVVVIGKNQNIYAEVALDYTEAAGIPVVRRITGGGAVYHDRGNVNFSFITSREKAAVLDFAYFTEPICAALAQWGVEATLSGRNDLLVGDVKFSGNAQYATADRILHHGTLLFDSDLSVLAKTLRPAEEKLHSKAIASVRSRVTNLREFLPALSLDDFIEGLARYVVTHLKAEERRVEPNETILSYAGRNRSEDYIFGRRENFTYRNRARFAGGMVTVLYNGESVIGQIRIEGDFFGDGEIGTVEQMLQNCPLDADNLSALLRLLPIEKYIHGVTAEEMTELILAAK